MSTDRQPSRQSRPLAAVAPAARPGEPPIYVTRPFLPPLEEFLPYLERIWASKQVTNGGPFHAEFEEALCRYLGVPFVSLFANATIALITALQALRIGGEVITTPYSFVATSHALLWNGIRPVFVDIEPETFNIDPARIEAAITPQTTAILAVHCYGNPCDVAAIERIAATYNLRVIYDAAHAFAVTTAAGGILRHGDLAVLSFHGTKAFQTFEGGAIVCPDAQTKERIDHLKNFGFVDEVTVIAPGINGKMSEFNAALGLLQLRHVDAALAARAAVAARYRERLRGIAGLRVPEPLSGVRGNNGYFPLRIGPGHAASRDEMYARLHARNIVARRYFHPLISSFPMYQGLRSAEPANLPQATRAAAEILCLPIYPELGEAEQQRVIEALLG
jgi:dTDP-4-amino-4,6-dideoxygalactose transaminase